jgi:uncharacterized membrane protein YhaH (DUF805 family)
MHLLFSFFGRIGRGGWWLGLLLNIIITSVILGVAAYMVPWKDVILLGPDGQPVLNSQGMPEIDWSNPKLMPIFIGYALAAVLGLWMSLAVAAKRFHDRGKTAWWVLIGLVPIVGFIWYLVDLGILEGEEGANKYGPDPRVPRAA